MDGEDYYGGADSGDLDEGYGSGAYDEDVEPSYSGAAAAAAASAAALSGPRAVPTTAKLLDEAMRVAAPIREVCACGPEESLLLLAAFATSWREHLAAAATAAPGSALLTTRCPAQPDCNEVVRPRTFRKFCTPELYARLCDFAGREWAQRSPDPRVRFCPAPNCT